MLGALIALIVSGCLGLSLSCLILYFRIRLVQQAIQPNKIKPRKKYPKGTHWAYKFLDKNMSRLECNSWLDKSTDHDMGYLIITNKKYLTEEQYLELKERYCRLFDREMVGRR